MADPEFTLIGHTSEVFIVPVASDDGNPAFRCELCRNVLNADEVTAHCNLTLHIQRLRSVENLQSNSLAFDCVLLKRRISALGSENWRNAVEALLFRAFLWDVILKHPARELTAAKNLLVKFEKMGKISLLELAVWKAVCIATYEEPINANNKRTYHDWLDWIRHGWKEAKAKTSRSSEIGIVIAAVLPYLD